jgi:xanthine/uracil permease
MEFPYGVDDRPSSGEMLLCGLQWFALSVPTIVIIGKVVAGLHFPAAGDQVVYLQKLFFVTGLTLLGQVLWGHRLPLILGPATVLLIGVTGSRGFPPDAVYSSILWGGLVLALLGATGLFGHLRRLFTARVVAVVLLLIAFTLTPTIVRLIVGGPEPAPAQRLGFALGLVAALFAAHRMLRAVWRTTLIVWATVLGSVAYILLFRATGAGPDTASAPAFAGFLRHLTASFVPHPGVLVSFLFCFLALSINDVGSIQSVSELLGPPGMGGRISRGMVVTGLGNALSGVLGVVGPVNYSLSPGVIASTGCASRLPLIPTGAALLALSFSPAAIGWLGAVPPVVVGSVLLYVLSAQIAAGLMAALGSETPLAFDSGLVIGLPVLLGAVVAALPPPVVDGFPAGLRPVLGNGFVVGVLAALLLEHGVFRR